MLFCAPLDSRTPYSQAKSQLMHDGQPRLERLQPVGSNQSGVQLSVSAPLDPGERGSVLTIRLGRSFAAGEVLETLRLDEHW